MFKALRIFEILAPAGENKKGPRNPIAHMLTILISVMFEGIENDRNIINTRVGVQQFDVMIQGMMSQFIV